MAQNGKNRRAIFTILRVRRIDVYLTSVRVDFKLASRKGSQCKPFLEAKTVKA